MPQNPDFSRKMMGFDGGVRVCASATLRCTSKAHSDIAVGFCFFGAPWVQTPMQREFCLTERKDELPVKQSIDNAF